MVERREPRLTDRVKLPFAGALLVCAFLLGGTSGDIPGRALLLELLAVASLTLTLSTWSGPRPGWGAIAGVALILAIPLIQLVPLPPSIWQAFPGREVAREISAFVDPQMWRPVTLDTNATLKSWLSLLLPVAMFLAVLQLSQRQRMLLLYLILVVAGLSVLLGLAQMSTRSDAFYLFDWSNRNLLTGVFANRNHQAALLYTACGIALLVFRLAPADAVARRMSCLGLLLIFAAGVFATGSRSGMALLGVTLALWVPLFLAGRLNWRWIAGGVVAVPLLGLLLAQSGVVRAALSRFARATTDGRYDLWPDIWYAASAYFPYGAGLGTFAKSYQAMEPLTAVIPAYVNQAHNEYVQMILELGVLGLIAIAAFYIWYLARTFRIVMRDRRDAPNLVARAALVAILALLLHSLTDYPIRTFAHLTLFGLLCGLLYRPPGAGDVDAVPLRASEGSSGGLGVGFRT